MLMNEGKAATLFSAALFRQVVPFERDDRSLDGVEAVQTSAQQLVRRGCEEYRQCALAGEVVQKQGHRLKVLAQAM